MTLPEDDSLTVLTGLSEVTEFARPASESVQRTLLAVALRFDEGCLVVEALGDSDECSLHVLPERVLQQQDEEGAWSNVSANWPWSAFIGGTCLWRWVLTNQSGYTDGAQVLLVAAGDPTVDVEVQWMVEASRLRPSVLRDLG